MTSEIRPRILVVDDEEAILETMAFTFEDEYEVFTSTDARRALDILDENAPIAVVLSDQRMPNMSGVEFVTEVCRRHPTTVRMILTGFADMDAIIQAINDGHVYAYITKPWEPDQLKQLMKQAVDRHRLEAENERLLADLKQSNVFLEAVMDHLDTGAIAVDSKGNVEAVNRPVREYLGLQGDFRGRPMSEMLAGQGLQAVAVAAERIAKTSNSRWGGSHTASGSRFTSSRTMRARNSARCCSCEKFRTNRYAAVSTISWVAWSRSTAPCATNSRTRDCS
jgi:CheY-like chemotaxis protein